jgi:anaerobic sulfite reductase subunit C
MCAFDTKDISVLKGAGAMREKDKNLFCVRLRVTAGYLTSGQLKVIGQAAEKYGAGDIHLTVRQAVEIPHVPMDKLEPLRQELEAADLTVGSTGKRVRSICGCAGRWCAHGIIDPLGLAQTLAALTVGRGGLPSKFKIAITGCPSSCAKPRANDIGIMGIRRKRLQRDLCTLCGACVKACPVNALSIVDGKLELNRSLCVQCGDCTRTCPTGAWENQGAGYVIFAGGRMGRSSHLGKRLPLVLDSEEEVATAVPTIIDWYEANAVAGERFGVTLQRLGTAPLVEAIKEALAGA